MRRPLAATARQGPTRHLSLGITIAVGALLAAAVPAQAAPFVYVTNALSGNVSQYDTAGGALAPLSPATVSAVHPNPLGVAVSADGRSAYVTTTEVYDTPAVEAAVLWYSVGTDGSLTLQSSVATPPNTAPGTLAVSPDGRSLYVANIAGDGSVIQYSVGAAGALGLKSPATVPTGQGSPQRLAVSLDGRSVYVTTFSGDPLIGEGSIAQYSVGADGTLSPKSPPEVSTAAVPVGVAVSPDSKTVYVANDPSLDGTSGVVSQYEASADGALSAKSPPTVTTGENPFEISISPNGQSVYVTDSEIAGSVFQYAVGATGALSPKSPAAVAAGQNPLGIAVHPDGRSVYAANGGGGSVSQYSVEAGGTLNAKSPATVAAGANPLDIGVGPLPRMPTGKGQCKRGGWRDFPGFRNQGECIAFVNRGPGA
jgi:6-phosphogluconolactonase (cycloisomerase 2 family)